jgi:hypothetical protein
MWPALGPSYNGAMTSPSPLSTTPSSPASAAGSFVEAIAGQDFDRIETILDPDATLAALLPRGYDEWHGAAAIAAQFGTWFGNAAEHEVVDAAVGQLGDLLELRWRLRLRADRLGPGTRLVAQHLYATTGPTGRIRSMRLLCSGFHAEHPDV